MDWADERAAKLSGGVAELEPSIAAALRAERARCARIAQDEAARQRAAEERADRMDADGVYSEYHAAARSADRIAEAIERPDPYAPPPTTVEAIAETRLAKKFKAIAAGWGAPRHDPCLGFTTTGSDISCGDVYELVDAIWPEAPK